MFTTPAVAGNTVYGGACPGSFFALDADTATVEWTHDTADDGDPASFHGDALVTEELVVGATRPGGGALVRFEPSTREIRAMPWTRGEAEDVPNEPTEAPFTGAVKPVVYVEDAETSARFYEEVLGFEHLGFSELDGAVYYAEMAAGGTKFGLHEPTAAGDSERIGRLKLYFRVRDLDAHRKRIAARDGEPGPVRETPYMDPFAVDDPDGNRIVFGATEPERHDFDPWATGADRGSAGVDPCR